MRPVRRTVLLKVATLLFTTVAVMWLTTAHAAPPQIITLPSGLQFRFAGVTYGTNRVPPSFAVRFVNSLPTNWAAYARKRLGNRFSIRRRDLSQIEPALMVWFERYGTNGATNIAIPNLQGFLSDEAGNVAGARDFIAFSSSMTWSDARFTVVPRRSRILQCVLFPSATITPGTTPVARISFPNPLYGQFPQWEPEPVPAAKQAGDLEVRLENFATGVRAASVITRPRTNSAGGPPPRPLPNYRLVQKGEPADTYFDVVLNSKNGTNESWVVQEAELSDATGNILSRSGRTSGGGTDASPMTTTSEYRLPINGTLWPEENAWKLKLWAKRKSGFPADDLVTFKNVPIPAWGSTIAKPITNMVNGVAIVITNFQNSSPRPTVGSRSPMGETQLDVALPNQPRDLAVDFVSMTTDTGEQIRLGINQWEPFRRGFGLPSLPADATTVDITLVVQKMRSVEFLVKPPQPTNGPAR